MKEQQIINKLRVLKTMRPGKHTLTGIKDSVYLQVKPENKTGLNSVQFGIPLYAGVSAFLLIVFLCVFFVLLPNQTHTAIVYGRLVFAQNQYERARIAFADTTQRFRNKNESKNAQQLADSLAGTNTQLDNLKLKGETGKYTAQECHQIYQEYLTYLKNISSDNANLNSEINVYKEQAEKKLHMYTSL